MSKRIKPELLRGFRDMFPAEVLGRDIIISKVKKTFESYGFSPIYTPALEHKAILLGHGDESDKQIYLFEDKEEYDVGLRYDLTVPLSRVIAQYKIDLPRPFKRYQIQPVWRFDKPNPGRYREFLQFDIDTVGAKSMLADSEIIAVMDASLKALGLNFLIKYNNRKILNNLIKFAGIADELENAVLRIIDKLEKQGLEAVLLELGSGRTDKSGAKIDGLGLNEAQIEKVRQFLSLSPKTSEEAIEMMRTFFSGTEGAEQGINELEEIMNNLRSLGITDDTTAIDITIARGLNYYTGPVFEAVLKDLPEFGSIMGGGRYDNLIKRYTGEMIPAVGASIGIDRLFAALEKLGLSQGKSSTADVFVSVMDRNRMADYQAIAKKLRDNGFNTELYVGNQKSITKQLKYADRLDIPVAIIAGEDEFNNNEVSIKDLRVIKNENIEIKDRQTWVQEKVGQKTIPMESLIDEINSILGKE